MRLQSEKDLLNLQVRKQIIDEIKSDENQDRKREAYKRYLIYKDKTSAYVIDQLKKQFDQATVDEMRYCISNISIARKIIDKLARVYNAGVQRAIIEDESATDDLHDLEKELDFNTACKKTNKFLKLQKNLAFYVKPCPVEIDEQIKYTIKLEPMNPYLYDAIESEYDRTQALAYVLSDFKYGTGSQYTTQDAATVGRTTGGLDIQQLPQGNGVDEIIADNPADSESGVFIFWSNKYHFTCDESGRIISEGVDNPIKTNPIINFSIDQDGEFWALGGDDLIDGSVLVNSVLTHNQHIATTQGYGQFWMKGKNLPRNIKIGPTKAILMEYEEGEPAPELGFASASPQIDQLRAQAEAYIALLLTTNNLSTSSVASSLGTNNTAPSGIAMMIDKAESREDTQDQQQIFLDKEPLIWEVVRRWLDIYRDALVPNLADKSIPEGFEMAIKFHDAPVVVSESEKLQNLKLRKELGLDTMVDLLMKDNPDLSEQDAEEKLKQIMAEGMERSLEVMGDKKPEDKEEKEPEEQDDGNEVDESIKE